MAERGASIIFARALAQNSRRDAVFGLAMAAEGRNKCSDLGLHSAASMFFNSSRCGHVSIVIDPSASRENVASGMGFFFSVLAEYLSGSNAERYEWGLFLLLMRSSVCEGHAVSKSNRIHGGGWPLESRIRGYTGRARL